MFNESLTQFLVLESLWHNFNVDIWKKKLK
jgi:hypothetical protein